MRFSCNLHDKFELQWFCRQIHGRVTRLVDLTQYQAAIGCLTQYQAAIGCLTQYQAAIGCQRVSSFLKIHEYQSVFRQITKLIPGMFVHTYLNAFSMLIPNIVIKFQNIDIFWKCCKPGPVVWWALAWFLG